MTPPVARTARTARTAWAPWAARTCAACTALGMLHDLLAPVVLVGLALTLVATRGAASPAAAAAPPFLAALAAIAVITGGGVGTWPALPLAAPILAAPFALPGLLHRWARRRGLRWADASMILGWLAVEAAFVQLAGLPVMRIGYAVAATPLAPLAGLAGPATVSAGAWAVAWALTALPAAARAALVARRRRRAAAGAAGAAVAAVAVWVVSFATGAAPAPGQPDGSLRVALVQTDVRAADTRAAAPWPEARAALQDRTGRLLRRAAASGADLVVAPEGAVRIGAGAPSPLALPPRPAGAAPLAVLAGAVAERDGTAHNVVVDLADGAAVRYEKRHPIPVAERRFSPGRPAGRPIRLGEVAVAASVCYDLLFAREIRRDARDADVLVAVSDAAFAGRSALPFLQLGVARLRAAESGRPLLFVTATGPTAVVDPLGRVVARSRRLRQEVVVQEVALRRRATPYARFGIEADALVKAALSLALLRRGVRPLVDTVP